MSTRGLCSLGSLERLSLAVTSGSSLLSRSLPIFSLSLLALPGLASFFSLTISLARWRSTSPLRVGLLGFFLVSSSSSEELDSSEDDSSLDSFLDLREDRFFLLPPVALAAWCLRCRLFGGVSSSESLLDALALRLLRAGGSDWLLSLSLLCGRRCLEEVSAMPPPFRWRSSSSSRRHFLPSLCRSLRDLRDFKLLLSLTDLW